MVYYHNKLFKFWFEKKNRKRKNARFLITFSRTFHSTSILDIFKGCHVLSIQFTADYVVSENVVWSITFITRNTVSKRNLGTNVLSKWMRTLTRLLLLILSVQILPYLLFCLQFAYVFPYGKLSSFSFRISQ